MPVIQLTFYEAGLSLLTPGDASTQRRLPKWASYAHSLQKSSQALTFSPLA